jgi:hypothetical protein
VLVELSKVEKRHDALVAVIRDGLRVTEVAEKLGVSAKGCSGAPSFAFHPRRLRRAHP